MINQKELDILVKNIQNGEDTFIYYIASKTEMRESKLDEHQYKSNDKFIVLKLQLTSVENALFEYYNYKNNPDNYHIESEDTFYDIFTEYIHYYTVPNKEESYVLPFNALNPSIIYGYREQVFVNNTQTKDYVNPSPVKEIYTNSLKYGDCTEAEANEEFNNHNLDWKYKKLDPKVVVDGIEYEYVTSNYYILDIKNFPRTEKALINTTQLSSYFVDLNSAFNYIDQLNA
jgi:hypothetical protein